MQKQMNPRQEHVIRQQQITCLMLGLRGGLAVVCWTAKQEVRGSNPIQGRNLNRDFCSMHTPGIVDNIWRHWLNVYRDVHPAWLPCGKFDSCNNLLSPAHTMLVIILQYAKLNIKTKILLFLL